MEVLSTINYVKVIIYNIDVNYNYTKVDIIVNCIKI